MSLLRQYILYTLFLFTVTSWAQKLEVEAPSRASTNNYFTLTYTVNTKDVTHFTPPTLHGFKLLSGPNKSVSESFEMLNGRTSSSESTTFTLILEPQTKGRFTISPASVVVKGKKIFSQAVTVEVSAGTGGTNRVGQTSSSSSPSASSLRTAGTRITADDLFVRATASRANSFEQEAILLTYRIFYREDIGLQQISLAQKPEFKNLVSQDIPISKLEDKSERIGNKTYRSSVVVQYVVFPQQKGTITIPSMPFNCTVLQQEADLDPLDAFFNGGAFSAVQVQRQSNALTLHIDALPQPQPIDFSGGVGQFTAKAELLTSTLRTNEVVTYRITISGTGNLKLIQAPSLKLPKDFETFDPKRTDTTTVTTNGTEGTVTFDYTFLPNNIGKYTLESSQFVFFNTETRKYETIVFAPLTLNISKGSASRPKIANQLAPLAVGRMSVALIPWGSFSYCVVHLIFVLMTISIIFALRRHWGMDADFTQVMQRRAHRKAKKHFHVARTYLKKNDRNNFYFSVTQALYSYISDKCSIPRSELTRERIVKVLQEYGVEHSICDDLIRLIDECELAQFAPEGQVQLPHQLLSDAEQLIVTIDKTL